MRLVGATLVALSALVGRGPRSRRVPAPHLQQEETRLFNSDGMGTDFHFAIDPWIVTSFSRHETIPPKGYKDVYYGIGVAPAAGNVSVEAKLRYRQADQGVAEKLLAAVPADMNLEATYGLKEVPILPVVDMVVKQASFKAVQ